MTTQVVNLHGAESRKWRNHPNFVYIGRGVAGFRRSKWANPYGVGVGKTRREHQVVVGHYRLWLSRQPDLVAALPELRGKVLGCWCKPLPCHGDVLAELADAPEANVTAFVEDVQP